MSVNVNHLKKDRAATQDAMEALLSKAETENRALTGEEVKAFDAQEVRFKELAATIERAERAIGRAGSPRIDVHDNRADQPFGTFGEQVHAVLHAAKTGLVDARLRRGIADAEGNEIRTISGMSETVPSEGGFFVQKDFATELVKDMTAEATIAPLCRTIPLSSGANAITINGVDETSRAAGSRWGGVVLYWAAEGGDLTASKPKFRPIELKLHKLTGLAYLTDEVLKDAAALESVTRQAFAEEYAFVIDDRIIRGAGVGQPLGILNASALVTVAKETGQAAATFKYENACKMYTRLLPRSATRAKWFINTDVLPQLFTMNLPVGTGGAPVFLPPGGASERPYGTLLGMPVVPIEQCSTLGTVGDVILADFGGYVLVKKENLETAISIHVRFLNDETVLRFIYRVDGQPYRSSALTPANGTNTLSSFVVLAVRN